MIYDRYILNYRNYPKFYEIFIIYNDINYFYRNFNKMNNIYNNFF